MDSMLKVYVRLLLHPISRYVLSWVIALNAGGITLLAARVMFDLPLRRDGNYGHTLIDFGGQWVMGRMLVEGQGRHLYHRQFLRAVVNRAYPLEDEVPLEKREAEHKNDRDAVALMGWLVGREERPAAQAAASFVTPLAGNHPLAVLALARGEAEEVDERVLAATTPQVGGALYPPINAFLMAPVGLLKPASGYCAVQIAGLVLGFVTGLGIRIISQGRIWWPVAATAVILYPGFSSSMNLGQNSILSVTLLVWGWTFLSVDRPVGGGICWGLLAFKPVWAATFFLVPLLTGRWRFCAAMLATGAGLVLLTLPWVGVQTWFDWIHVGRKATAIYENDYNWIFLSRDLLSIPRRWLLNFNAPYFERDTWAALLLGWSLLLMVFLTTVLVALLRNKEVSALRGPFATFLLLGAWLCCFHFMFYDVLLTALPILLLLTEPRRYLEPVLLAITRVGKWSEKTALFYGPRLVGGYPASANAGACGAPWIATLNSMILSLLVLFIITDLTLPALKIEMSVSAPFLDGAPFPVPLKYSTAQLGTPWSTFSLILLWLWCGMLTWRRVISVTSATPAPLATHAA